MLPSERIKNLVEDSGIPYTELEKRTGISKSALQRYASGTTKKIPIDAVESIANALDVTTAFILGWETKKTATTEGDGLTDTQRELLELILRLDDSRFAKVLDYIRDQVRLQNQ